MSEKVKLTFRIEHYKCELAPKFIESAPRIEAYFSSEIDCKPVEIKLIENSAKTQVYQVELEGTVNTRRKFPLDAKLVFASFCTTFNDTGAPCMVDAGTAFIPLAKILKHTHGVYTTDVHLKMHSVENYEKGRFKFTARAKDFDLGRVDMPNVQEMIGSHAGCKQADEAMAEYLNRVMAIEGKMGTTIKGTKNVRCPFYYGQAGMQSTTTPVPAAGYCMFKAPKSNLRFWKNAMDTVLDREGKTAVDVKHMDWTHKARLFSEIMVLQTQYFDYMGDKIDTNIRGSAYSWSKRKGCEVFGTSGFCKCGDCEDHANHILQTCASFRRADVSGDKNLMLLQRICCQYIPFMSLDAVTAAAVGDHLGKKIGAHMNVNFLSAHYVKECLDRAAPMGQKTKLPFIKGETWSKHLPVLIGEGTGMFEPYGVKDTVSKERSYVYGQCGSLKAFKKPIVHPPGAPSGFFVGSLLGFTDYWFDLGSNVGGMWYGYRASNGFMDRGVNFVDLERKRDNVCIMTHPPIPTKVMKRMREAVSLRIPAKDLMLSEHVNHPQRNKHLDALVNNVQMTRTDHTEPFQKPVSFYVKDYQLTPKVNGELMKEFAELDRIIKVDYKLESITDEDYGYRVHVYADA